MLAYENQMLLDVLHEDGLLVAAKGLGLEHVLYSLIKVYSDPGNLILVLGTTDAEEEYYTHRLEDDEEVKTMPKKITTDYSTSERQGVYLQGGVLFVTTRILVVDMLMERLPIHLVTGILVVRAHKTAESCQESFILRLYRQKNKTGFIKAFSSAPGAFKGGVERAMRNLFVSNLCLWPRFHADVSSCLRECTPAVVELHLEMTQPMMSIQSASLDLINFTLQELKRINPTLEAYEELNMVSAVGRSFQKQLQTELDPIWHQLSWKTKQLVSDLRTLRTVLLYLTQYDCVTFLAFVSALRTTDNAMKSGGWMILDAAETLFLTARQRVFGGEDKIGKRDDGKLSEIPPFEENPKWMALSEILEEIKEEVKKEGLENSFPSEKVLVLTTDERTMTQLQDYMALGAKGLLSRMFNKSLGENYGFIPLDDDGIDGPPVRKKSKNKGVGKKSKSSNNQTLTQMVAEKEEEKGEPEKEQLSVAESPVVMVHSMQSGVFELYKLLYSLHPSHVVMYDTNMSVVRQLEVYQANHTYKQLKVTFLMYDKSVDEQSYLTTLRKEKEAFESLIGEKATMVVPEYREGRGAEDNPDLARDGAKASDAIMESVNSRRAGGQKPDEKRAKIIVDMREFRSELPSLIHKRGVDIDPVTIEVGDYILTPEICVERKSISDLIGSLQNGRLFNQATSMTRFYAKPMLLIEFDQNKPFALQGKYYLSKDIASTDITARLQLLTIHFPRLRILWSPSPHATAELFEELKKGREQPDAQKAAAMSFDFVDDFNADKFNANIKDILLKLPGITSKNVYAILNKVGGLVDLMGFSAEELGDILGSSGNGKELYDGLHIKAEALDAGDTKKRKAADVAGGANKKSRFKSKKK